MIEATDGLLRPVDLDRALRTATIVDLLAATSPDGPPLEHGGICPDCSAPAWATDQITWTCNGHPRPNRHHPCPTMHRGTIHRLRRHVAEDPDALARLLGRARLIGAPLHPHARTLPAVDDDWALPADLYRAFLTTPGLDHDDQLAWLREFCRVHGHHVAIELMADTDNPPAAVIEAHAALTGQGAAA